MHEPLHVAYISSILGKSTKANTPLAFECALVIGG